MDIRDAHQQVLHYVTDIILSEERTFFYAFYQFSAFEVLHDEIDEVGRLIDFVAFSYLRMLPKNVQYFDLLF
jgi:hypothetical protein